ncbi:MAG: hypothetical protein K2X03_26965 [Bryobacteraceae bacterium]|nr:hypothetical protein [Bryobacteraceae bacterium]
MRSTVRAKVQFLPTQARRAPQKQPPGADLAFGDSRAAKFMMKNQYDAGFRTYPSIRQDQSGLGPGSGGQSGDTQGLSGVADATSESVKELVEEGQFFEAEVISGIENAPDADLQEVTTTEVLEDDVPLEYLRRD